MVGALLAAAAPSCRLFRNPLADPALVGVSSGGALAGDLDHRDWLPLGWPLPFELAAIAAFVGAALGHQRASTASRQRESRTSAAIFLLGGLATAALANAGIGFWYSSLTTGNCATSRSGMLGSPVERPAEDSGDSRPSGPRSSSRCR